MKKLSKYGKKQCGIIRILLFNSLNTSNNIMSKTPDFTVIVSTWLVCSFHHIFTEKNEGYNYQIIRCGNVIKPVVFW